MVWKYANEIVEEGRVWTDADGIRQSPQWHIWSRDEKIAAGLVEAVEDTPERTLSNAKAEKLKKIKFTQFARLSGTDWFVIRRADTGELIPDNIAAHRAALLSRGDEMEADIDNLDNVQPVDAFAITWPKFEE